MPCFGDVSGAGCWHLALEFPGARCFVPGNMKGGQFRNAYFMSLIVHSSQKLWPKHDSGNFAPFKTGGSQNLWKPQYLSKIRFLTFVDLSKHNIQLPGILGNPPQKNMKRSHASTQFICVLGAQDTPAPELFTAEFVTDISDTPIVIEVPLIFSSKQSQHGPIPR